MAKKTRRIKKSEILLDPILKTQIADELNTTLNTVRRSLQYHYNSPLAVKIRQRAKELLLKEAESIDTSEDSYNESKKEE
ncbi:MAG: hypothetical protein N4A72_06475 [Bacteroidales bacterium]|jgi:DeoR/GlpR family transcriptional regulator of sugar metabolism|nr:hypothetical protein [Bacteroidales bacterium]